MYLCHEKDRIDAKANKEELHSVSSLYIGVMSGTSLDGIDVAIVDISNKRVHLVASHCYPIPEDIRQQLTEICITKQATLQQLGEVDHRLGHLYADAINDLLAQNNMLPSQIEAIGCHGQTIYHAPNGTYPFTMQMGDANIIATKTNITTIADFRRKDMALGGQGAPLVPAFHQAIFANKTKNSVILNIGGIANFTVICPDHPLIGYDTGPGNTLLDTWIYQNQGKTYDKDAQWALSGHIDNTLLTHLLDEPYFNLAAPKSTGRELFNLNWLNKKLMGCSLSPQDIQATLVEFTVVSVVNELKKLNLPPKLICELVVCGGGARNPLIMQRFTQHLSDWSVKTSNDYGVDMDYVEAMAFAWLAHQRRYDLPGNVQEVTGATRAVSLGAIYPK